MLVAGIEVCSDPPVPVSKNRHPLPATALGIFDLGVVLVVDRCLKVAKESLSRIVDCVLAHV